MIYSIIDGMKRGRYISVSYTHLDVYKRQEYTLNEVMEEVLKDKVFYKNSKGGVTLSGGEPLIYADFNEALLKELKKENIHTAVDTCGYGDFKAIERISKYTDLFLYDLKLTDDEKHILYTGVSNKIILDNLLKLSKIHDNINLRLTLIEGINACLLYTSRCV